MTLAECEAALAERGWLVIDLPDPLPVHDARDRLLSWLRGRAFPDLGRLDDYHLWVGDDDRHVELLHGLATYYWKEELGRPIIAANLDFYQRLIGPDLVIQRHPYLRAARPGKVSDAAPMHRDTYYGASPYEISVLVPFTDMDADGALRVVPGSHLAPDSEYPFVQQESADVTIRSPKHQLGYPYAPRVLDPGLAERAHPVPLAVGQVLIFGLSLVHGGGVNHGHRTRFSTDIRVANALAPIAWSRGVRADYFVPLCTSAVTRTAQRYLEANQDRTGQGPRPEGQE